MSEDVLDLSDILSGRVPSLDDGIGCLESTRRRYNSPAIKNKIFVKTSRASQEIWGCFLFTYSCRPCHDVGIWIL